MEFLSNDGRRLATLADWRDHGGPVSAKQWVEGGSARELARAWIELDAAARVTALLTTVPAFAGLILDRGIAEKETRFDDIRGGPRHHDLLVVGAAPSGPVVIGVEGKADEPFDERLDVWVTRAVASERSRAPERLDRLTTAFFGTTLDDDPLLAPLRYQLLSGLAGTLADARERGARQAVLLVHEFETPWTDDERHRRNADDLEAFVGRLMPAAERTGDERAWIAGPGVLAGDGTWLPESADVYVAKLATSTR
ncbi:MAG: DUF6946 family protein [Solirubrobacteraceae bacterium]